MSIALLTFLHAAVSSRLDVCKDWKQWETASLFNLYKIKTIKLDKNC